MTPRITLRLLMSAVLVTSPLHVTCGVGANEPSATDVVGALTKRQGGAHALDRWKCGKIAYRTHGGIIPREMGAVDITEVFDFPNNFKRTVTSDAPNGKHTSTYILSSDGGWMLEAGRPPVAIDSSFANRPRHSFADILDLAPLESHIQHVRLLGPAKRDGTDTICIELASDELGSCQYFVARETGLLVEYSHTTVDPTTGKDAAIVTTLRRYRDIDGIPVPMSISATRNGDPLLSIEIRALEFKDSYPASTFKAED